MNKKLVTLTNIIEKIIAVILIIAITIAIFICVIQMGNELFLQNFQLEVFMETILTLVIGIEFVRMLILHTKESVLEVLLYAVARQIVISHDSALDNLIGVLAIMIIFMIQKFLLDENGISCNLKKRIRGGKENERQDD